MREEGQRYERHYEESARIRSDAKAVFELVDDHARLSSHMMQSSWMMGGGTMRLEFDGQHGRAVGSHIQMKGRILGMDLSLDEVVTTRQPPELKAWATTGSPRLLVIGHYRMGVRITSAGAASDVTVFVDYNLPDGSGRWLGLAFGGVYARWCVRQMLTGIARALDRPAR